MKNLEYPINDWSSGVFLIEKMNHLQQEILQTPTETNKPCEALAVAYQMLTDEQKIAFILVGGAPVSGSLSTALYPANEDRL